MISVTRFAARVPVPARELEAGLDGFRAAVAEERRAAVPRSSPGARPAGPAADGKTGSTCAAASSPDPRWRASVPDVAWPSDDTPMPESRSRYSRPSASNRRTPSSADERDRLPPVRLQHVPRLQCLNVSVVVACLSWSLAHDSRDVVTSTVPFRTPCPTERRHDPRGRRRGRFPAPPTSRAAPSRPSTMTTSPTPCASASRQAFSLATMPAVAVRPR